MAKILVDGRVLSHSQISGVERYVTEMCRSLPKIDSRHRFRMAIPPSRSRIVHHAWEHSYLPILCLKEKADLLFCPANIAPLFMPRRVKLVVTIHGLAFRYYPESYSTGFGYYYSILIPRILRSADAVIAVSKIEKESILKQYGWVDDKKIHVVSNGINDRGFKADGGECAKEILSQRYAINGDFVLSVGSFTRVKNFKRLIEAFLLITDRTEACLVLVCGAGRPLMIESGANVNHPRVKVVDYVHSDLAYFYQAAKLLVFPSLYEGFGFPPLEAMACGCPVVVSNVAALPEVCGDAAVYVDPNDTQSIAGGMQRVLSDDTLRRDLIERGLRRVKNFTWEKTAGETLKVFDEIMGDR